MRVTLLTLLAAQSALAFPMVKRQSEVLSSITSVVTAAIPTVVPAPSSLASEASSAVLSATQVASSAISSIQESAAPSSAASAAPSFFPGERAYPCPPGTNLVYVETQSNYNGALQDLIASTGNFGNSSLFQISNVTGQDNTVGQTRTVMIDSAMANEVLTNYTVNPQTNAVYLTWNATAPAMVNGLTIGAYSTEQQVYINDTETSPTAPVSTVKLFSNICASDEMAAQPFFLNFFQQAIMNGTMAVSGAVPSGSMISSAPISSAFASASSVISQAVTSAIAVLPTGAVSSISSVVDSAIPAVSSGVSSAAAAPTMAGAPAAAGALMVQTPPSLVQCQPASINFQGGQAPYFLSVLPGGSATAAPLLQFAQQSAAGSYVWNTNIAAGTSVTLQVRDGTGAINFSSPIIIQASPDSSCLVAPTSA